MNKTRKHENIIYAIEYNYRQINKYQQIINTTFESCDKDKILGDYQILISQFDEYFKKISPIIKAEYFESFIIPSSSILLSRFNLEKEFYDIEKLIYSEKILFLFNREYVYLQIFKIVDEYQLKVYRTVEKDKDFDKKIKDSIKIE